MLRERLHLTQGKCDLHSLGIVGYIRRAQDGCIKEVQVEKVVRRSPRGACWSVLVSVAMSLVFHVGVGGSSEPPPPTSRWCPDVSYLLETEMEVGGYTVRLWQSEDQNCPDRYVVQIVERGEVKLERAGFILTIDPLTGTDITGDGAPDMIVRGYSGGAHCCFSTIICSLANEILVYSLDDSPGGNCQGEFKDLDGDDVFEFVTCDDSFAYRYCCFACSPMVTVVLELDPAVGYRPSTYEFPWLLADDIQRDLKLAERASQKARGDSWDGTTKCEVLPLVLDLLYIGEVEQARSALERYYLFPDREESRLEIEEVVFSSPFFALPEPQGQ